MRKLVSIVAGLGVVASLSACGHRGYGRSGPDEFAVARQAPLVIPPDFSLQPPAPGAAPTQSTTSNSQTLEALFGPNTARSGGETAAVDSAGDADVGVRSTVGDPETKVIDKGQTTRDIVAAPEGDGQDAKAATPAQ